MKSRVTKTKVTGKLYIPSLIRCPKAKIH